MNVLKNFLSDKSYIDTFFILVSVKPDKLTVKNEITGENIEDGSTMPPVNEGTRLVLNCESGFGKPVPVIEWWNGTQLMEGERKILSLMN